LDQGREELRGQVGTLRFDINTLAATTSAELIQHPRANPLMEEFLFKLVIVGDSAAGKSSLIIRFAEDTYSPKSPTLNAEFKLKSIVAEGHNIKLQMWDTAGQERFRTTNYMIYLCVFMLLFIHPPTNHITCRTVSSSYYRGAHAVLVVYDVSEPKSLQSAGRLWLPEVDRYASSSVVKYLVGTKIDVDERKVSLEDAQKLADEWSLPFIETSSKTGEGVEELFVNACKMILRQMEVKPAPRRKLFHTLSMGDVPRKKKTCFI